MKRHYFMSRWIVIAGLLIPLSGILIAGEDDATQVTAPEATDTASLKYTFTVEKETVLEGITVKCELSSASVRAGEEVTVDCSDGPDPLVTSYELTITPAAMSQPDMVDVVLRLLNDGFIRLRPLKPNVTSTRVTTGTYALIHSRQQLGSPITVELPQSSFAPKSTLTFQVVASQ